MFIAPWNKDNVVVNAAFSYYDSEQNAISFATKLLILSV